MTPREDLVVGAVEFLRHPDVIGSPLENKIKFLEAKNLTQEEIDAALARADVNGSGEPQPTYSNYAPPQQQVMRPQPPVYGPYQQYPWPPPPPPEPPKRDWRDWFIMATVMGGVGYGLYFLTKRYVYPIIAPPTAPQLEQDKQAIDESFEKAFALLDQLAKDTETLKASELSRTERLDKVLEEVEKVVGELKLASRHREDESRRIGEEVRGLKDLIPKAMEGQKETTDIRLKELNTELKSLKTLMGQRMNPPASQGTSSYSRPGGAGSSSSLGITSQTTTSNVNGTPSTDSDGPKPASVSNGTGSETFASLRNPGPFSTGASAGRAAIPAWQMAAANKSSNSVNTTSGTSSGSQDAQPVDNA